jgi:ribonuclease G
MVGDVHLGRVARVLPGIRAAFIDLGLKHDAFLHFSDIGERTEALQGIFDEDEDEEEPSEPVVKTEPSSETPVQPTLEIPIAQRPAESIQKSEQKERQTPKLHKGQEILIQIIKEPVKDKGVRVTSSISIPGRFCVLCPWIIR